MKQFFTFFLFFCAVAANAQNNYSTRSGLDPALEPFYHGVASGDPLSDRVIIWSRVTPNGSFVSGDSIEVAWRMATDTGMTNIVNSGTFYTKEDRDFTIKVDVTGLNPESCYYYDFFAYGKYSVRGRTKTAPTGDIDSLRFAVMSCSNYEYGYFHSYRSLVNRDDIDAVLHLGDYIYEYEVGGYSANIPGREHDPVTETITLQDYRTRYSHYRLDEDCRDVHQQFPFITVWDDHESTDNSWKDGAENHTDGVEGVWADRKGFSMQAYFEWLPVREAAPGDYTLYRKLSYGDLIDLFMLDTRLEGRDEQVGTTSPAIDDPSRSLLGTTQYNWLTTELSNSTARWKIIGQQVMFAPLEVFGTPVNADQWDGYAYERDQLVDFFLNNTDNIVVLTGDIHTSWANDIPGPSYNSGTGSGSAGVEFVVTSVTSPGLSLPVGSGLIQSFNPHMKYIDLSQKGYLILDVNKNRAQADWYYVSDVTQAYSGEAHGAGYFVNYNERWLNQASSPSSRIDPGCIAAPEDPISTSVSIEESPMQMVGIYPNPFNDELLIQFNATTEGTMHVELIDLTGKTFVKEQFNAVQGLNYMRLMGTELAAGMYNLTISNGECTISRKVVRQ